MGYLVQRIRFNFIIKISKKNGLYEKIIRQNFWNFQRVLYTIDGLIRFSEGPCWVQLDPNRFFLNKNPYLMKNNFIIVFSKAVEVRYEMQ